MYIREGMATQSVLSRESIMTRHIATECVQSVAIVAHLTDDVDQLLITLVAFRYLHAPLPPHARARTRTHMQPNLDVWPRVPV